MGNITSPASWLHDFIFDRLLFQIPHDITLPNAILTQHLAANAISQMKNNIMHARQWSTSEELYISFQLIGLPTSDMASIKAIQLGLKNRKFITQPVA